MKLLSRGIIFQLFNELKALKKTPTHKRTVTFMA
jgi:hypothetical protein